eukprot:1193076-Prorocentrum_minimum.AAC.2
MSERGPVSCERKRTTTRSRRASALTLSTPRICERARSMRGGHEEHTCTRLVRRENIPARPAPDW